MQHTRSKNSDIDNVLGPVAELMTDEYRQLNYTDLDSQPAVLQVDQHMDRDPHPIPMPIDRENYGNLAASPRYWATGLSDWLNVQEAISRFGAGDGDFLRYLDFGCASGRVLRHAHTFANTETDLWGCDFAPANINWIKRYLPKPIKGFINNAIPHLPFPDQTFDLISAFSVLTHIDQFEDAWLLELRRVTRPDGLLYLTIQNEASWSRVPTRPNMMKHLERANSIDGNPIRVKEGTFAEPMPLDRIVFRMTNDENYNCNVWHSSEYIRNLWSRYFEILHIADNAHTNFQSVVILRPLDESRLSRSDAEALKRSKPR